MGWKRGHHGSELQQPHADELGGGRFVEPTVLASVDSPGARQILEGSDSGRCRDCEACDSSRLVDVARMDGNEQRASLLR